MHKVCATVYRFEKFVGVYFLNHFKTLTLLTFDAFDSHSLDSTFTSGSDFKMNAAYFLTKCHALSVIGNKKTRYENKKKIDESCRVGYQFVF